jgi:D-alanyl-D-alanine carboxypeptidase
MEVHNRFIMRQKILVLAICAILVTGASAESAENEDLRLQLQEISDAWIAEFKLPGAIVAIALPNGATVAVASGYADKERGFRMLPSHRLHSGSFAKTFTAAVALALRNEGKVDLDAAITRYIGNEPWFRGIPDGDSITLRQLLGMRTGLTAGRCVYDPATGEPCLYDPVLLESMWADYRSLSTYPDIFRFVPMWRRPTLKEDEYVYTDEQYILAGVILEKASSEKIEEAIQRRFVYPFQLLLTSPSDSRVIAALAKGYSDDETRKRAVRGWEGDAVVTDGVLNINYGYPFTSGHYFTNPLDAARWVRILYSGKAMPGAYLKDMFAFSKRNTSGEAYGLGVMTRNTPNGLVYEHDGGMPGYMTIAAYYPAKDFSVAVQANKRKGEDLAAIRDRVARCVASFLSGKP